MGMGSGMAESANGTSQGVYGMYQLYQASKLKPDNYIPPSLRKNLDEAETLASKTKYVGQAYDEGKVAQNTANAIERARQGTNSSANFLNFVASSQEKENQAMNAIGQKSLAFQQVNRNNAVQLRNQKANLEMDNMKRFWAAKSALKGAGQQNMMQGHASINQGAGSFMDSMMSYGTSDMMGGMTGGGAKQSSAPISSGQNPMTTNYQQPSYQQMYNMGMYS
jgi:hypothetical protein